VTIKQINKKEKHLALLSAIAATIKRDFVIKRGHQVEGISNLPLVIDDKFQSLKKTNQVLEVLEKIGLSKELNRIKENLSIRAGKGKRRGRKYRQPRGPLIVVKDDFGIYEAARNIAGIEVVKIENLDCSLLAPGTHCGRLTIWTQSAFNELNKK
jgi:large subunit ribosomal protein L4e